MPEQQREPGEQPVGGQGQQGRPDIRLQGGASTVRHTATSHENETETVEEVGLDGLGRHVTSGIANLHVAAAGLHSRKQPREAAQSPSLNAKETNEYHAEQLSEEFTISQVSRAAFVAKMHSV